MLAKRIIPCLDIKDGRTVKGVNFENIRDAGDAVELARTYAQQGADELVLLDITATHEKRKTLYDLVGRVAAEVNIPFTVGGGISTVDDVGILLSNGADKVSINSAAIRRKELIADIADKYGSQCVVVAIDARQQHDRWLVHLNGGRIATELDLFDWAAEAGRLGAGEILFTSMDHDGTKDGFATAALQELSERIGIPVIASGGAGSMAHFRDAFAEGKADAALAASVFHFGEIGIPSLKDYLSVNNISIRPQLK